MVLFFGREDETSPIPSAATLSKGPCDNPIDYCPGPVATLLCSRELYNNYGGGGQGDWSQMTFTVFCSYGLLPQNRSFFDT